MKGLKWLNQHSRLLALASVLLLLLSFFLCFIQVKNASAIGYNVNLRYVKKISSSFTYYYRYGSNSIQSQSVGVLNILRKGNDANTYPDDPFYVQRFCSTSSFDFDKDDFVDLKLVTQIEDSPDAIGTITDFFSGTNFEIMNISVDYDADTPISEYRRVYIFDMNNNQDNYFNMPITYYPNQFVVYDILLRASSTGNFPVCVGRDHSTRNLYTLPAMQYAGGANLSYQYRLKFSVQPNMLIYRYDTSSEDMNEKDDEDRDNIENQQSDSQDSSDDSQEEAESTGTTLLAAFSSFVTAITNASPSNCNLLMNMGNLNLGNVNLCQLSPPPAFQAIASIFMILFCVPLSIATARKVIDLFRSFQT